jgi:hypothetical protein
MRSVLLWLRQPTSVAGLSAIIGTGAALLLHQIDYAHAAPLIAGAAASIVLPDNAGARTSAEILARDFASAPSSRQEKK